MIIANARISRKYLSSLINLQLDQIFTQNMGETNKVTVEMKRIGDVEVSLVENDVLLKAPIDIFLKKGEGLFTAEAHGKISIDIKIELNIDDEMRASTRTDITGYKWIDKPTLDIGVFEVSVEKMTDLGLNYYESSICGAIDAKLKPLINLNHILEENLSRLALETKGFLPEGIHLDLIPKSFMLENFATDGDHININLGIDPILSLSSGDIKAKLKKSFRWVDKLNPNSLGFVHFKLDKATLRNLVIDAVQNKEFGGREILITKLGLQTSPQSIALTGELSKPIECTFTLQANPLFNEHEAKLYVKGLDLKVKPKSFIHKLGAPIFTSFIKSQMEELFPIDLNQTLNEALAPLKPFKHKIAEISLQVDFKQVRVNELLVTTDGVEGMMAYEDLIIKVLIGEEVIS